MKIIVTGALGHIGSRVIRELPEHYPGCEIVMIDNMKTQRFPSLFNLSTNANYRFIEADVASMDLTPHLIGADAVIHLAALTDATSSFGKEEELEHNNYLSTKLVAEACAKENIPMIHASSTSVYGSQSEVVDETCSAEELLPQSPYAETKLREEALIKEMCSKGILNAVTFRFGTIFGVSPGIRFHTAVNKFCWQAVMGQPITVWKTAYDQKRPYLDLGDAVRAMVFIVRKNLFTGLVYNVVTENTTVRQVVATIQSHVPDLEVTFVDSKIMNQLSYEVLNTRLSDLGFTVEGSIEKGIEETLKLLLQSNSVLHSN